MRHRSVLAGARGAAVGVVWFGAVASAPCADAVIAWNDLWLDTIRATGGPPTPIARAGAMLHGAVYDAVNGVDGGYTPYLFAPAGPVAPSTDKSAAAAQAARDVLVHLYPARQGIFDSALAAQLATIPNGPDKSAGVALGMQSAAAMIAARSADGSAASGSYTPGTGPGDWRPTYPTFAPAITPHWGDVTPFCMAGGAQFRPLGPGGYTTMGQVLASPEYTQMFDEVKSLGSRASATRTPEQTEIAWFWANDRDGTYKPPGQLNKITQVISADRGLGLVENARLFALLNLALGDAGVAAWDCKYNTPIDLWRPIAGIREADTDGNSSTTADPSWEPLLEFTPPFPAWVSGHATFGATHAAVLRAYFGTDNLTFTAPTDEPIVGNVTRTFTSLSQAALENGRSRVYLGVHWQWDADAGYTVGTNLGDYVYANFLQAVPEPGALGVLTLLACAAGKRARRS